MSDRVTIFMPLASDAPRGLAAEDKDYRPVEAERLEGDIYRVVGVQPQHERWAYPSGATVFAVKIHAVTVIVAPSAEPTPERIVGDKEPRRARRLRLELPELATSIGAARAALFAAMLALLAAAGSALLEGGAFFVLQPADPIRASVVASSLILIVALWQARRWDQLRAVGMPSAIVGAAFVLSLVVARCQA